MEMINVPKPMGHRMGAKAPIMETVVARTPMKPVVPNGFRIGDSSDEEQQGHAEYAYSLAHTSSLSVVSGHFVPLPQLTSQTHSIHALKDIL
jgi:hypothetical protein